MFDTCTFIFRDFNDIFERFIIMLTPISDKCFLGWEHVYDFCLGTYV